ncbi:MAG TPA: hypothetical protein VGK22_11760 [Candidatus Angelobacter sp.]|jgi:hypothetical protein
MSRKILLLAALTIMAAYGQAQSNQPSANQPAPVSDSAPYGGPITTTPIATFTTPAPTAGISDAGRAGISVNSNAATQGEIQPAAGSEPDTIAPAQTETAPAENMPTNDLGASGSVNAGSAVVAPLGVAEAASRFKTEKNTLNARVLSNEDVQAIVNGKTGVTTPASMASGSGAPAQTGQPSTIGAQAGSQIETQSITAQPVNEQNSSAQQSTGTETNTENATTPQINQNQQSNDAPGTTRLPATSTFLPLLGLMGLASGGFGLWFRRFRK